MIGERIRDKVAASRKRGIWMGGWAPLGYDVKDRKLVINEAEANLVRSIFKRFARYRSGTRLVGELAKENARNKYGKLIEKGYLYRVLNNRVYLGEAVHKGTAYPGEHEAIIEQSLWNGVHEVLQVSPRVRARQSPAKAPALLKGLIFAPDGRAMTPTHTRRRGRLYRYYVSTKVLKTDAEACPIGRLPAAEIEAAVIDQVRRLLQSPEIVVATWREARKSIPGTTECQIKHALDGFDELWSELFPAEQARIIQLLVERVDVREQGADVVLKVEGLTNLFTELQPAAKREAA